MFTFLYAGLVLVCGLIWQSLAYLDTAYRRGELERVAVAENDMLARHLSSTLRSFAGELFVAVNLAMRDMHRPGFAERLLRRITMAGLSEATVTFEITENSIMRRPDSVLVEPIVLREAGFRIAIDGFGTGDSSLGYLERLRVDALKIDRIFVDHLRRGNARRCIAATTVAMAESLGIDVIAEGVETHEQLEALSMIRCRYRQGFLYGRPVPDGRSGAHASSPGQFGPSSVLDGTSAGHSLCDRDHSLAAPRTAGLTQRGGLADSRRLRVLDRLQ